MTTQTAICLVFLLMLALVVYVKPPPERQIVEKLVIVKEVQLVEKPVVVEKTVEKVVEKTVPPPNENAGSTRKRPNTHPKGTRNLSHSQIPDGSHEEWLQVPCLDAPTGQPCTRWVHIRFHE